MDHINEVTVKRLLKTVDAGLIRGLGKPIPGQMCVEAAVCFALGLPHSDNPDCVDPAVKAFKIRLNDSRWKSTLSRAKGLRKVAVAQLGSKGNIASKEFSRIVAIQTVKRILPIILRKVGLTAYAIACENVSTVLEAKKAAYTAAAAADTAADAAAAAYTAAAAADTAADAADTAYAAAAAADTAAYAAAADTAAADAADTAAYAADTAYAAAAYTAAAYAADTAAYAAAAYTAAAAAEKILNISADICLQALIQLKSPGCQFLYLCGD